MYRQLKQVWILHSSLTSIIHLPGTFCDFLETLPRNARCPIAVMFSAALEIEFRKKDVLVNLAELGGGFLMHCQVSHTGGFLTLY